MDIARNSSEKIVITTKNEIILIKVNDILFCESDNQHIYIHTTHSAFIVWGTMKELIDLLPQKFIRSHRSYIINTDKIHKMVRTSNKLYKVSFRETVDKFAFITSDKLHSISL